MSQNPVFCPDKGGYALRVNNAGGFSESRDPVKIPGTGNFMPELINMRVSAVPEPGNGPRSGYPVSEQIRNIFILVFGIFFNQNIVIPGLPAYSVE
jgi:hypothetical protein